MVSSSEMLSDNLSQNGQSGHASSAIYGLDSEARGIGKRAGAIELHNAYIAAGTLAAAILIVAIVVSFRVGGFRLGGVEFEQFLDRVFILNQ